MLVRSLAKRGYLDVLKRRVPLYRPSDLGREVIAGAAERSRYSLMKNVPTMAVRPDTPAAR